MTSFYKGLLVFMMLFGLMVFTVGTHQSFFDSSVESPGLVFVLFFILIGGVNILWIWRHKEIEVDKENIYITRNNFISSKTISLPLTTLREASQGFFQRGGMESVTLEFIEPTEFGTKIVFIPKWRFYEFTQHPIVDELNQLRRT